ncbi:MAG: hypothetical protein KAS38_18140, partial [Anaerolineales bacterium]|nr:hypothetical protein [Anaerolineales bacterium]
IMVSTSPRVWGYSDYSEAIKAKVPPQTWKEKRLALVIGLPWIIFAVGFPIYSTYVLKSKLGGEIPFWTAFLNLSLMVFLATLCDLVILDWLIVNKITPEFVIIPGTDKADYQDFSHHYRAHARAAVFLVLLSIIFAGIVWYF